MRRIAAALLALAWLTATGRAGESVPGGQLILSEESVWRGHIVWMPAVSRGPDGKLARATVWNW